VKSSLQFLNKSNLAVFSQLSGGILKVMNYGNRIRMFFNPHLREIGIENYDSYSQVRQWSNATVRFLAFHPQCFKMAIASVDDTIRIYTNDENSIVPLLKNSQQKSIFSLSWRPFSPSTLAVGCQNGFLIWTIDPSSNITRPLSQAVHYRHENHFPVTSLEFNHNGSLLATASFNDTSILIWNIDKLSCTPLKRTSIPFLSLQWSLNGTYIFTSTVANVFRVWNCDTWKSDRWTVANGHVQSFQWSPCGKFLLFITSEDPILYSLGFADEPIFNDSATKSQQPQRALPIADLTEVEIGSLESGGKAKQIAWDGKYVAISFKRTNSVAIFQTTIRQHHLHILPMFFVCGLGTEYPTFITFQPSYKNSPTNVDNVLTIAWSSGRIQFYPFM
jgi:aladin